MMEYPTVNPTEIENEMNFLTMKSVEAFRLCRQGLLDLAGYQLTVIAMDNQKAILNLRHQGVPIKTELNNIIEEARNE